MFIEAMDLIKTYQTGTQMVMALNGISFKIPKGSFTAVLGPSGSGKSTLFNVLAGIDGFDSGSITVNGHKIEAMNARQLEYYRKDMVGMVFQGYNLLPDLTVYENIKLVADLSNSHLSIDTVLERLSIQDFRDRFPFELSGGQQQRTAIARAVVKKPGILLCDEPTAALDSTNSIQVLSLLQDVNKDFSTTIFLITHNEKIAKIANYVMHLCDGRIVDITTNEKPISPTELDWKV